MINRRNVSYVVLLSTLALSCYFSYWLISESDDEKVHRIFKQYDRLILEGKRPQARQLFKEALHSTGNGALDPVWLPLVRSAGNGYEQLAYYERVLIADPDREASYRAIANLIEFAPEVFHNEVKPRYLKSLATIPGVHPELLYKHGLVLEGDN